VAQPYVAAMNDLMRATLTRGTGRSAALPGQAAGGKTGTSQGSRDAWFVGYTPYYVAGIWIGNDDGARMDHVTGGTIPARLWRDVMLVAHQGKEPLPLPSTRSPWAEEAVSHLPWNSPASSGREPFYRRVFGGIFGG
jgi:penicillin-binding protein 1A